MIMLQGAEIATPVHALVRNDMKIRNRIPYSIPNT